MATSTATREFYRQKTEGQPDQLIDVATKKTLTPEEFGKGAGFTETKGFTREKIEGQPDKLVSTQTEKALTPTEFGTGAGFREISNAPIKSSDIENTVKAPEPTSLVGKQEVALSDKIGKIAEQTFTGTKLAIDNLRAQEQDIIRQQKETAQKNLDDAAAGIKKSVGTTELQDAQAENDRLFNVKDNIEKLTNISQKIVDAQEALKVGLIFEGDRPVRMQLLTGRQASLQSQGLATIGALQGSAAVIQGNINLAKAYGEQTLNAIKSDNNNSINALNTLLNLYKSNLITLNNDEKKLIDDRLKAIEDENTRIDENKDKTVELMLKYPDAFSRGGVTLLDDYESALRKMLPIMAQKEKTLYDLELAQKNKALKGGGSGGSSAALKDAITNMTQELGKWVGPDGFVSPDTFNAARAQWATNGLNVAEFDKNFAQYKNPNQSGYVDTMVDKPVTPQQAIENATYSQFINADGTPKAGYEFGIDEKTGKPTVKKLEESSGGGFWSNIGQAFGSLFGGSK